MKKKIIFSLFLVILFLSGCTGNNASIKDINYYEGSDGLVMEFMTNSPPSKIYPEQSYPITLFIHNKGAFSMFNDVSGQGWFYDEALHAEATLIFDPFYFSEVEDYLSTAEDVRSHLQLEGKSAYWPGGESKSVTLGVLQANSLGPNRMGAAADISVSLCFPYETVLTTPVCVDNDPYENSDPAQPCHIEDLTFQDQGAPVAIKSVGVETLPIGTTTQNVVVRQPITDSDGAFIGTEDIISEELLTIIRPVFRLSLENVGDGQIIRGRDRGEQKNCLKDEFETLPSGSVTITALLGNKELTCKPSPSVFRDGKLEVVCMMKPEDDLITTTNYFDILQVYVSYVYQIRDKVTIEIDDSSKQYVSPSNMNFKCMDFDNDYNACKSYGQDQVFSDLDCYYCDSLKKCVNKDECESICGTNNLPDEYGRLCSNPCPKPRVSISVDKEVEEFTLRCTDNPSLLANERERCGCTSFQFGYSYFETCDQGTTTGLNSILGKYVNGLRSSTVTFPILTEDNGRDSLYLCAWGLPDKDARAISDPGKALIYHNIPPLIEPLGLTPPAPLTGDDLLNQINSGNTPACLIPSVTIQGNGDDEFLLTCKDNVAHNNNCACRNFRVAYRPNDECSQVTTWSSNYAGSYDSSTKQSTLHHPVLVGPNFNAPVYLCVQGIAGSYPYKFSNPVSIFVHHQLTNDASNDGGVTA